MRRVALIALAAFLAATAVGAAQDRVSQYDASGKVTPAKGGSKRRPVPVAATAAIDVTDSNGQRPVALTATQYKWTGVRVNDAELPTCTADEMATAQTDAICPPGSLVATGRFAGLLGPELLPGSKVPCRKTFKVYNGGGGDSAAFFGGDPNDCSGVGYLPPLRQRATPVKGGSLFTVELTQNVVHPLPGLEGALTHLDVNYTRTGYLEAIGCGKATRRTVTWITRTPGRVATTSADAGRCIRRPR